jgi:DNA polymerase I-like protein with 3'-5' exonuclease and polymerase domains
VMELPSLKGQGMISIDCETYDPGMQEDRGSGAHRDDGHLAGISVATEAGFAAYYPVGHESGPNLPKEPIVRWLKKELATPVPKVGAHLLYDMGWLAREGIKLSGPTYDIQIADPLIKERFKYSLDVISKDWTGRGKTDDELDDFLKRNFGGPKSKLKANIWRAPPDVVAPYAIDDAKLPLEIFAKQRLVLEKDGLWDLFVMESKLIPMLLAMRQRGVRVDLSRAERMRDQLKLEYQQLLAEIKRLTGHDVDVWAAKSIGKVFDAEGIPYPLTPKTKQPSFTAEFLDSVDHPMAEKIVRARKVDKLVGTFLEGCILEGHYKGRVHCQFNQLKSEEGGAVSGRFSSSKPNLQFIPVRTDEGRMLRRMFLADEGEVYWHKDYSQIEFRLLTEDAAALKLPGAQQIVEAYRTDPKTDFHEVIAQMAAIDRRRAKTINFGLAYGEGVAKLARQLGLSRDEAEAFIRGYHRKVPFMRPLMDYFTAQASKTGEIRTLMYRRRRFDLWESKRRATGEVFYTPHRIPGSKRAFTYRALNARTQGGAADVMKKAMVDVWESGVCDVLGVPQLTVHDELDGSFKDTKAGREALAELHHIMEHTVELSVPLKVDGSLGPNWGDCE